MRERHAPPMHAFMPIQCATIDLQIVPHVRRVAAVERRRLLGTVHSRAAVSAFVAVVRTLHGGALTLDVIGAQNRMRDHVEHRFCVAASVGPNLRRQRASQRDWVAVIVPLDTTVKNPTRGGFRMCRLSFAEVGDIRQQVGQRPAYDPHKYILAMCARPTLKL